MLEASGRTFAAGPERAAFIERWLGRFLAWDPEKVLVAVDRGTGGEVIVAGYLIGATDNPAATARFADLGYFRDFAPACEHYPAHLHINLRPGHRGGGYGVRLIAAFADMVRAKGVPGLHVVTAADARNVRFYARCGFKAVASTQWNGRQIVMLGLSLAR